MKKPCERGSLFGEATGESQSPRSGFFLYRPRPHCFTLLTHPVGGSLIVAGDTAHTWQGGQCQ